MNSFLVILIQQTITFANSSMEMKGLLENYLNSFISLCVYMQNVISMNNGFAKTLFKTSLPYYGEKGKKLILRYQYAVSWLFL